MFNRFFSLFLALSLLVGPVLAQPLSNDDMRKFEAIIGIKKFVNFGEDSHFMTEVHRSVVQMFRYLVEKKKFRVFVFEVAWGIEDKFNADLMKSDRTEVNGDEQFFLNAFNSKVIVQMLVWIREWNRKNPNDKIQIAGYQPEQPVTDFRSLWAFTEKSEKFAAADLRKKAEVCRAGTGEFKTDIEFISAGSRRRRAGQMTYTTEERANCNKAIDAIETFIAANKNELMKKNSRNAFLESQLHIKSLRTYLNTLTYTLDYTFINKSPTAAEQAALVSKVYDEGDRTRFEIFEVLRETRYKDKKIFFWMHNWHAMKFATEVRGFGRDEKDPSMPGGTVSIGERMAKKYGKELVVIGNIIPKAVCKNPICTPPPVRADSLETKFQAVFGSRPAMVDIRKGTASNQNLPIGVPGSIYADINQGHFADVVLKRQFDAILYLPETTATFEDR